jgi:hypothetical protein
MAHKSTVELQKLANGLAKKVRQEPTTSDAMYQLLTVLNARLKLLEEAAGLDQIKPA